MCAGVLSVEEDSAMLASGSAFNLEVLPRRGAFSPRSLGSASSLPLLPLLLLLPRAAAAASFVLPRLLGGAGRAEL